MPVYRFNGKYKELKKQKNILNKYGAYLSNAVTDFSDGVTEMGVPIADEESVVDSRLWQEENEK